MINKMATYYMTITLSCLWVFLFPLPAFTQTEIVSQKIWAGIGGQDNWENARYFMFTCQGPDDPDSQGRSVSYLWDRETGNCRYEGITPHAKELVVLFNLHDRTGRVFIDGALVENEDTSKGQIAQTLREFKIDAELLFLPALQEGRKARLTIISEKLVGSSRQFVAHVENDETAYGSAVEGIIHIDARSGRIEQWQPQQDNQTNMTYEVSGYKDIGGGLILPTRFFAQQGSQHVVYPVAATLIHIEPRKFTHP